MTTAELVCLLGSFDVSQLLPYVRRIKSSFCLLAAFSPLQWAVFGADKHQPDMLLDSGAMNPLRVFFMLQK